MTILSNHLDRQPTTINLLGEFIQTAYFANSFQLSRQTTNNNNSTWTVHSNSLFWHFRPPSRHITNKNQQKIKIRSRKWKSIHLTETTKSKKSDFEPLTKFFPHKPVCAPSRKFKKKVWKKIFLIDICHTIKSVALIKIDFFGPFKIV